MQQYSFQLGLSTGEAWKELAGHKDRSMGVLGGALVEEALENALMRLWREEIKVGDKQTVREQLAANNNFTFSLKIDLAFLNFLIGPLVHRDLTNIRGIRNRFAHRTSSGNVDKWEEITFNTDEIKSRCNNLLLIYSVNAISNGNKIEVDNPKGRFLASALIYTHSFLVFETIPEMREPQHEHHHLYKMLMTELPP